MATASAARYSARQLTSRGRITALIVAAFKGHTLVVEQLIAAGAGLDVQSTNGYDRLWRLHRPHAVQPGTGLLGRLTALMWAASVGHTLVVEQLIAAGAGLDVQDNEG